MHLWSYHSFCAFEEEESGLEVPSDVTLWEYTVPLGGKFMVGRAGKGTIDYGEADQGCKSN